MTLKRIGAGKRMSDAVIYGDRIYLSGYIAETAEGSPSASRRRTSSSRSMPR